MSPSNPKACLRTVPLLAMIVALLTVATGQPAHAQGGLLKKFKEASKVIQTKAEQADTAATKVEETAAAMECLADDANCAEQSEVPRAPGVASDSGGTLLTSTLDTVSALAQCEPRALPDSSEAASRQSLSKN